MLVGNGEVDTRGEVISRDDGKTVDDTGSLIASESNEVEIELGCAVSTEDGIGIEDVNAGTGDWNEPLIRSSLNRCLSKSTPKSSREFTNEKLAEYARNGFEEFDELTEVN